MKFPRQKEVFYLRHLLLNFPKRSFADCARHNGKSYNTYEETLLATGHFARSDEADCVMQELIDLRYTVSQLRLAFVLLLHQDAAPVRLFSEFSHALMKDFRDSCISLSASLQKLWDALLKAWVHCGHSEHEWPLGGALPTEPAASPQPTDKNAFQLVRKDSVQNTVLEHVLTCLSSGKDCFVFCEGKSGTGKSTLASALYHEAVKLGKSAINVATTGQAALQLPLGAKAHSTFGIPIDEDAELTCTLGLHTATALRIVSASLIQWDE